MRPPCWVGSLPGKDSTLGLLLQVDTSTAGHQDLPIRETNSRRRGAWNVHWRRWAPGPRARVVDLSIREEQRGTGDAAIPARHKDVAVEQFDRAEVAAGRDHRRRRSEVRGRRHCRPGAQHYPEHQGDDEQPQSSHRTPFLNGSARALVLPDPDSCGLPTSLVDHAGLTSRLIAVTSRALHPAGAETAHLRRVSAARHGAKLGGSLVLV